MVPTSSKGVPVSARAPGSDKHLVRSELHDAEHREPTMRDRHERHTVAKWSLRSSLSGRLSLFVALIVAGVVTSAAYLEVRSFGRDIDHELVDAARFAAQ